MLFLWDHNTYDNVIITPQVHAIKENGHDIVLFTKLILLYHVVVPVLLNLLL